MIKGRVLLFLCVILSMLTVVDVNRASPNDEPVRQLEILVQQWVDLEYETVEAQRVWQETKSRMEQECNIVQQRITQLHEQRQELEAGYTNPLVEIEELQRENEATKKTILLLKKQLDAQEAALTHLLSQVPEILQKEGMKLRDWPSLNNDSVAERLQRLLTAFKDFEEMQNQYYSRREIVTINQQQRQEVDVVYIGLSRACAVSKNNDWAAVGYPGESTWVWNECSERAPEIRQIILGLDSPTALQLSHLPLTMQEEKGQ